MSEEKPSPRGLRGAKYIIRLVVSVGAALLLLSAVFWFADLEDLSRRLAQADVVLLLWSLLAYSVTYLAKARRYDAAGARAAMWKLLCVVTIHGALNRIMPLRMGELAYPWLIRRVGAAALGEGLVQLMMLRLLDLVTIVLLFSLALASVAAAGGAGLGASTNAFVVAAVVIGLVSLVALVRLGLFLRLGLRVARALLRLLGRRAPKKIVDLIERGEEAVDAVTSMTGWQRLRLGFWSVVCWGSYFVLFYLILLALDVPMSFLETVLGSSAAIVGSTIPISGLGTFGALEGGWTAGFVAVGLDTTTAASSALVMSGLTLVYALILGAIGWLVLMVKPPEEEPSSPRATS